MKRRKFLWTTATGTIAGSAIVAPAQDGAVKPLMLTPVSIMAPRPDGAELVWAVSRLCRARVECKDANDQVTTFAADDFGFVPQGSAVMRVRLSGLVPGAAYHVRVVADAVDAPKDSATSEWKTLRTLNPAADTSRFVVWNDTHENAATLATLHEKTPAADFLVWNGDTCNDWHKEETLVPVLLHPGGQDITQGRPLCMSWGNHDVRGKFAFKARECMAMPEGRPFYALRTGPVAALFLHTGEDKPDDHPSFAGRVAFDALRREQTAWIKEITAQPLFRDAPHRIVFCHIPLRWTREPEAYNYAGGEYDHYSRRSRDAWHDALVAWGAQTIISGHTHRAAWLPPNEQFPYGQLTGGGPRADNATWIEGHASSETLKLSCFALDGKMLHEVSLARR